MYQQIYLELFTLVGGGPPPRVMDFVAVALVLRCFLIEYLVSCGNYVKFFHNFTIIPLHLHTSHVSHSRAFSDGGWGHSPKFVPAQNKHAHADH